MLSVITSPGLQPEIEPIDRDPGIISLASRIVRFAGRARRPAAALVRGAGRTAGEKALFSSASSWPHISK